MRKNIKFVDKKVWLPTSVNSPVHSGEIVGKVAYYLYGNLIAEANIYSTEDVGHIYERPFKEKLKEKIKEILFKI